MRVEKINPIPHTVLTASHHEYQNSNTNADQKNLDHKNNDKDFSRVLEKELKKIKK